MRISPRPSSVSMTAVGGGSDETPFPVWIHNCCCVRMMNAPSHSLLLCDLLHHEYDAFCYSAHCDNTLLQFWVHMRLFCYCWGWNNLLMTVLYCYILATSFTCTTTISITDFYISCKFFHDSCGTSSIS